MFPYWLLAIILVMVLGSMGWMTVKSGKTHKAAMTQAKQTSPQLVEQAKKTKERAQARLEKCQQLRPTPTA